MIELKNMIEDFQPIWDGVKLWEYAPDDVYKVGDQCRIREYDLKNEQYTGREVIAEITYIIPSRVRDTEQSSFVVGGWR
jgi:hypothetical protein